MVTFVQGNGAFKVSDKDYFATDDIFNYEVGSKRFMASAPPIVVSSDSPL